jgi:hypothetical protein
MTSRLTYTAAGILLQLFGSNSCSPAAVYALTVSEQLLYCCMLLLLLKVGAGFYINATVDKWKNWRMYDYITKVKGT